MTLRASRKQKQAIELLKDPTITDYLYGGGAGGSKTFTVCAWMVLECWQYDGIRIGLGRKELTRLKQTTVATLLNEVHPMLGVIPSDYKYKEQQGKIEYLNGSEIQFIDLARMPSDPEYDRFGSLNLTHVVIEEAGEVVKKARDVFISRKNRYLNHVYHITGKSISTCNPSQNYLKNEYYKPYVDLGGGEFQKWEHGRVEVDGELVTAYRVFIRALATDNPFLPQNYIEGLRMLPAPERKRLLDGDWDFADDDRMVFPSRVIDKAYTDELSGGDRYIGVDIADTGADMSVISLIENNVLVEQMEIATDDNSDVPVSEQTAMAIIQFAQTRGFEIKDARKIAIDGIGVGVGARDFLIKRGWKTSVFIAGGSSNGNYNNLRSEVIYEMGQAIDRGELKIYKHLKTINQLREQLMAHEYETEERKIKVSQKAKLKEILGRSPDNAESMYIAYWVSLGRTDPRYDASRIAF